MTVEIDNLLDCFSSLIGISYDPMPSEKLYRALGHVGDSDPICKKIKPF